MQFQRVLCSFIPFDSSFAVSQMKTMLDSWCSFTRVSLRRSSVGLEVKVFVLNMCFCFIRSARISDAETKTTLRSLCAELKSGIKNEIQASTNVGSVDVLGHGVKVKDELQVSCLCRIV